MHTQRLFGKPRHPIRALIFDMDGTILDTREYHMESWRVMTRELGLGEREFRIAEKSFGQTNWAIFKQWFGPRRSTKDWEDLSERKERIFRDLIRGREPARPGFGELIAWARRRGLRIALATSGPRSNAEFILDDLGIRLLFDVVVWGLSTVPSKPRPHPFLRAARLVGYPPQHCLVFEDSVHGFQAAARAGMRSIGILDQPGHRLRNRSWTPFVFEDFRPAIGLLRSWAAGSRDSSDL